MSTEEAVGIAPTTTTIPHELLQPPVTAPQNVVPLAPAPAPAAIGGMYSFMPTSLAEAIELSKYLAKSTIVPKQYIDQPANVFVAMQWGAELGMRPLQALQNIAVINGKPGLYGDAGKALLLANGCQIVEDDGETVRQQGFARCTIQRRGRPPVTRTFSVEDAQTAKLWGKDGPWTTYPTRQLAWRAFWFAARDAAADILRGMQGAEELADYIDVAPSAPQPPRVAMPKAKAQPKAKPPQERRAEGEEEEGAKTPASEAMLAHLRKVLARGELSGTDVNKRYPDIPESLEGLSVAQVNRALAFAKDPTA